MNEALETIINDIWIKYRGCLIERTNLGFRRGVWTGFKTFETLEQAKEDIDKSILRIQKFMKNASR